MPRKRPRLDEQSSDASTPAGSSTLSAIIKRPRSQSWSHLTQRPLSGLKIHVVQAKLSEASIDELFGLVESCSGKLCKDVANADIIITDLHMLRRLGRHLDLGLAREKAIVIPRWLHDSVRAGKVLPCGDYAAIHSLRDETAENCPECQDNEDGKCSNERCRCRSTSSTERQFGRQKPLELDGPLPSPPPSPTVGPIRPTSAAASTSNLSGSLRTGISRSQTPTYRPKATSLAIPAHLLPPPASQFVTALDKLDYAAHYCCQRASPLLCPNQGLVEALDIIRNSRALESEERSALSYSRAIAAIKAYPVRIKSKSEVEILPFIGTKVAAMVDEYLETGKISESETLQADPRFVSLSAFATVYGIGSNTARELYARGLRTLEHLERYYEVDVESMYNDTQHAVNAQSTSSTGEAAIREAVLLEDEAVRGEAGENLIKAALGYRRDLAIKIPRDEVEEIGRLVMLELEEIEPGCVSTIVGGYRRGKPESGDVDLVVTHPSLEMVEILCKKLVRRLINKGLVTHVIHQMSFHRKTGTLKTHHWDSLEKALTVFVFPESSPIAVRHMSRHGHRLRRRLDLIFTRPETYWTAVVGWSGSTQFQRDLRRWAKHKGLKFDSSGITRRRDSKVFYAKTEREVFDILGLEWIEPIWRNADA